MKFFTNPSGELGFYETIKNTKEGNEMKVDWGYFRKG
jgi:hypothetical protein